MKNQDLPPLPDTTNLWMLQLYTGNGKGKTTCALGLAVRALGNGYRVAFVQFDKGFAGEEHYAERRILRTLEGLDLHPTGCERMSPGKKFRFGVTPADLAEAERGLSILHELIAHPRHQVVICDEIISALPYHLLKEAQVQSLVEAWEAAGRPFELVMTGRRPPSWLLERADLVTEMTPVRHYFDKGIPARAGIEF